MALTKLSDVKSQPSCMSIQAEGHKTITAETSLSVDNTTKEPNPRSNNKTNNVTKMSWHNEKVWC